MGFNSGSNQRLTHNMKALILVDIQNDFLPGGALAVAEGDLVVPVANQLAPHFDLVVATQDFHPAEHGSFAPNHVDKSPYEVIDLHGLPQVLWPVHCVEGSPGADFAPGLDLDQVEYVFPKGTDPDIDSYSGFFDNGRRKSTGLGEFLQEKGVEEVFVMGLATDFCVKFTALDAVSLGFSTYLIRDGVRGVNIQPEDSENAIREMEAAGIRVLESSALTRRSSQGMA